MATPTAYVAIGDLHIGDKTGLTPPETILDFGVPAQQSPATKWVWDNVWRPLHDEVIPWATNGQPYVLTNGGDTIDGVHHRSTSSLTANLEVQERIALEILRPVVDKATAYFQLAGTEAHDGQSWSNAQSIARQLGSPESSKDDHIWRELKIMIGDGLVHDVHHVSTTGTHQGQVTGITRASIEQFITAAKYGVRCPDVFLRHHCHHATRTGGFLRDPCQWWQGMTVPGWQLKGPYPWKNMPDQVTCYGGVVVRWVTNPWVKGHLELIPFTRSAGPSEPIILKGEAWN